MTISFRAIEMQDLEILKNWRNSNAVRNVTREYRMLSGTDQNAWYRRYLKNRRTSDWDEELMIVELDGRPIGAGGFTRIQWRSRRAELSFYVGEKKERNSIVIKAAVIALLGKGFLEFNFHKITWPVYAHDVFLDQYQQIFETEAVLKEEYSWDGRMQDRYYLSLTKKQFDELG